MSLPPPESSASPIRRVVVYCASSRSCDAVYHDEVRELGALLAGAGIETIYGGGAHGSMGALADGVLGAGGEVVGVLPNFMSELEWGHPELTRLELVDDMRTRKHRMLELADAVIALPGGCGTFEELMEAITLKRLGLWNEPIVIVNTRGFFDPLVTLFDRAIRERFMNEQHLAMWRVVANASEALPALAAAPAWSEAARGFAVS